MRIFRGALLGLAAAGVASLSGSLVSAVLAGYSRNPFETFAWLYQVAIVPAALGGTFLAMVPTEANRLGKRAWFLSTGVAFTVVALSGSVGAIAVESSRRGLQGVNVTGYLAWCWVYALAFLPLTLPLTWGAMRILWRENS